MINLQPKQENLIHVSIIIPCKNEIENLKWTVDSILNSNNSLGFEIIVVDDGSIDGSTEFLKADRITYKDIVLIETLGLGVANAKNKGAEAAKGNYLFFCDAHIKVKDEWLDELVNTMKNCKADLIAPAIADIKGSLKQTYGLTWNKRFQATWILNKPNGIVEVPFVGGGALCITKEAFKKIHGFNYLFRGYGVEDQELCLKAWLYGYKLIVNPEISVRHLYRSLHPYQINPTDSTYNTLCLAYSHFNAKGITKIIGFLKTNASFPAAAEELKKNQDLIFQQREMYFNERIYDTDFFIKKFNIVTI